MLFLRAGKVHRILHNNTGNGALKDGIGNDSGFYSKAPFWVPFRIRSGILSDFGCFFGVERVEVRDESLGLRVFDRSH